MVRTALTAVDVGTPFPLIAVDPTLHRQLPGYQQQLSNLVRKVWARHADRARSAPKAASDLRHDNRLPRPLHGSRLRQPHPTVGAERAHQGHDRDHAQRGVRDRGRAGDYAEIIPNSKVKNIGVGPAALTATTELSDPQVVGMVAANSLPGFGRLGAVAETTHADAGRLT